MYIKEITYSRLVNTGNYENARVEATIVVNEPLDVDKAYDELKQYVDKKVKEIKT